MDIIRLIKYVESHVFLYDKSHDDYKNCSLKAEVWESIAQELGATSDDVKYKWKTVRDCYIKCKRLIKKSDRTGRKVVEYVWAPYLKFLDAYPNPRRTRSQSRELPPSLPELALPQTNNVRREVPPLEYYAAKRPKRDDEETGKKDELKSHDATDYLFLSYAQTFKKFSARQQVLLKMELAKLFMSAELNELGYSSPTSSAQVGVVNDTYRSSPENLSTYSAELNNECDVIIKSENDTASDEASDNGDPLNNCLDNT